MSELDPVDAVAQIHVPRGHQVSAQHHRGERSFGSSRRCGRVEAAGSAAGVLMEEDYRRIRLQRHSQPQSRWMHPNRRTSAGTSQSATGRRRGRRVMVLLRSKGGGGEGRKRTRCQGTEKNKEGWEEDGKKGKERMLTGNNGENKEGRERGDREQERKQARQGKICIS